MRKTGLKDKKVNENPVYFNISDQLTYFLITPPDQRSTESIRQLESIILKAKLLKNRGRITGFLFIWLNELFNEVKLFDKEIIPFLKTILEENQFTLSDLFCIFNINTNLMCINNLDHVQIAQIDWFEYVTGLLAEKDIIEHSDKWNHNTDVSLLMTGKLDKEHRLATVTSLIDHNILHDSRCKWSLIMPKHNTPYYNKIKETMLLMNDQTKLEVNDLFKYENQVDLYKKNHVNDMFFKASGYVYDVNIFKDTKFSIVLESDWAYVNNLHVDREYIKTDCPWITEKTYREFLNYHPFITVSGSYTSQYLKTKGYELYLDHVCSNSTILEPQTPNREQSTAMLYQVIPVVYAQTLQFLNKNQSLVRDIIDHNYRTLFNNISQQKRQIGNFSVVDIDTIYNDINDFLCVKQYNTSGLDSDIRLDYSSINRKPFQI